MTRQKWSVNEIAFVKFAQYKGFKVREIGSVLDRTKVSVSQLAWKMKQVEAGKVAFGSSLSEHVNSALQLEYRVRAGELPELKDKWSAQLSRVRGIETVFVPTPKPDTMVGGTPLATDTSPLIHIDINITMDRARELLSIIFGKGV